MPHAPLRFQLLSASVIVLTVGCGHDPVAVEPTPEPRLPFTGLVTNSASANSLGPVAYVSLPPGASPNAYGVTVENRRTRRFVIAAMVRAGFDPVPISAQADDSVLVTLLFPDKAERRWSVIPQARPPTIVRSEPAGHDVPLNAPITVVFSEPIDPQSVTSATVALEREGEPVPGTLEVLTQQPWVVRFTPATPLAGAARYELLVTDQIRDLDGDRLDSPANVSFTTTELSRPGDGRIAFSSWSAPGGPMIFTMNPDGSDLVQVVRGLDPSFSPDGKRIAFWRYEASGVGAIYVADADGSNIVRVSDGAQPTWSPDGRRLAYGCGGICVINVDGTGVTTVTPPGRTSVTGEACVRDTDPSWSPNGTTIAFTRWPDAQIPTAMCLSLGLSITFPFDFWTSVYLIELDGSNLRAVRDDAGNPVTYAGWPSWSPDGTRVAFYYGNGTEERIQVANPDGTGVATVARSAPVAWDDVLGSPAWSPDGRRILIRTGNGWAFTDAAGSGETKWVISPFSIRMYSLSWSWSLR